MPSARFGAGERTFSGPPDNGREAPKPVIGRRCRVLNGRPGRIAWSRCWTVLDALSRPFPLNSHIQAVVAHDEKPLHRDNLGQVLFWTELRWTARSGRTTLRVQNITPAHRCAGQPAFLRSATRSTAMVALNVNGKSLSGGCRSAHAAALGAARHARPDRHQIRLRHRPMRRLHRAY